MLYENIVVVFYSIILEVNLLQTQLICTVGFFKTKTLNLKELTTQFSLSQVSADDLSRLATLPGLERAGVGALQLVYATLATLAQQPGPGAAGPATLTQATLVGGVQVGYLFF